MKITIQIEEDSRLPTNISKPPSFNSVNNMKSHLLDEILDFIEENPYSTMSDLASFLNHDD